MSKWKSPYNEDRHVPLVGHGRIVKAGEVVNVPDRFDDEFEAAGWEPVTTPGKKIKDGE